MATDDCPRLPIERGQDIFWIRNDDLAPTVVEKRQGRLDLGPHAPLLEMSLCKMSFHAIAGDLMKNLLIWLFEVQADVFDIRRNDELLQSQFGGQQGRSPILVDHRFDSDNSSIALDHRDPSAANRNHDDVALQAFTNHVKLNDVFRHRRGNNSPIAACGILDDIPSQLQLFLVGDRFGIEWPDRFRRFLEGGIRAIDENLGHERHNRAVDALLAKCRLQCALEDEAYLPLCHCHTDIERQLVRLG